LNGSLAATEQHDQAAVAGRVEWLATLAASEAPDEFDGASLTEVYAALDVDEDGDTALIDGKVFSTSDLFAEHFIGTVEPAPSFSASVVPPPSWVGQQSDDEEFEGEAFPSPAWIGKQTPPTELRQ
jgi:hypothetical protein